MSDVPKLENKESQCCGGPVQDDVVACCVQDAEAKSNGEDGCVCSDAQNSEKETASCCS